MLRERIAALPQRVKDLPTPLDGDGQVLREAARVHVAMVRWAAASEDPVKRAFKLGQEAYWRGELEKARSRFQEVPPGHALYDRAAIFLSLLPRIRT